MPFHPKLTLIYGKNAAGKSGFVRILKRLANSRTQEDIWQNVHATKTRNNCSATVVFDKDCTESIYKWNGEKDVEPFQQMSIFDGRSVPMRLTQSLELSYQPYGFELFQVLSASLQSLQERISRDVQLLKAEKPDIENLFSDDTKVGLFVSQIGPSTTVADVNKLPKWDQKAQRSLTRAEERKKGLQNLDLQSEVLGKRLKAATGLRKKLEEVENECSAESISTCTSLIGKINSLRKKRSAKKERSLDQYDIPKMDSDEWGAFVDAGEEYINVSQHERYPLEGDKCIYCLLYVFKVKWTDFQFC
jgi:energy-coupling factor transporter ATP-binding protein EcfA2